MSQQLKFVASLFKMVVDESFNVMGPETVQTLFRLIGERQGEAVEKRLREKYEVEKWTAEDFAEKFTKEVLEPALGEGQADYEINGDEITINIKACPFQQANMKISDKLFCTYTQGLIEQSFIKALNSIEFTINQLIAEDQPTCGFKIKVQQ